MDFKRGIKSLTFKEVFSDIKDEDNSKRREYYKLLRLAIISECNLNKFIEKLKNVSKS